MANKVEYELSLRDLLSSKIDAANSSVNRLEKSLSGVKGSAMSLGSAFGIAFGIAGVVQFTKSVITAGTTVENALTGLTTLLKDAKEAQGVIDKTMQDAKETPFAFEGLLSANKAFISAGVESKKANEDVLNLANAVAATGGGDNELNRMVQNLQQIKNVHKATAKDIMQFGYAGINIFKVLESAGIKAGESSEITYEQITMALKKAHEEGGIYANGLENMQKNTSVQISNLGDAFFQLSVKIFQDLKPAIEAIIGAMFKFIGWLKQGWEWMTKNKEILKTLAVAIMAAWTAFKVIAGARVIIMAITAAMVTMAQSMIAGKTATIAFTSALNITPLGIFATALGLIAGAFFAIAENARIAKEMKEKFLNNEKDLARQDLEVSLKGMSEVIPESEARKKIISKELKDIAKLRISNAAEVSLAQAKVNEAEAKSSFFSPTQKLNAILKAKEGLNKAMQDSEYITKRSEALADFQQGGLVPSKSAASIAGGGTSSAKKSGEKSQATGSKAVTINVSIKDLIGTYNMNVTNVKEMGSKVKDIVVQALTGAVNDFQVTAGA